MRSSSAPSGEAIVVTFFWPFAKVCLNLLNIFAREEMGEGERIG